MSDGPDNVTGRGTYKGPLHNLKGQKAELIMYPATGRCMARFENVETGYAFGLHDFETAHFDLETTSHD